MDDDNEVAEQMSEQPDQPVVPEPEPRFDTRIGKPFITIDIPEAQMTVLLGTADETGGDS